MLSLKKQGEQKSVSCNEEDKKIINFLRKCVQEPMGTNFLGDIRKADVLAWLEKQGEQKPNWSEEDTRLQRKLIELIYSVSYCDERENLSNWLKSLKDRVQPEQKQEWTEEDEKRLQSCLTILQVKGIMGVYDTPNTKWLKSLKDRYTWKPSDEQLEAFEHFVRSVGESGYASPYDNNTKLLHSLLSDLKKLIEE